MKEFDPQDLSPSEAGTGNSSNLGLAEMSVWCLMTMLKAAVTYAVLKHPFQGCAKNARASLILYTSSKHVFDRAGKIPAWLLLRKHCSSKMILLKRFSLSTKHSKPRYHLKVSVNK